MKIVTDHTWSPEQLRLLHQHYSDTSTEDLVALLGRNADSISNKARTLKLQKSPVFLASPVSGRHPDSPVGKEYLDGHGFVIRKTDTGWCPAHIMEWEAHYGPVPAGHVFRFKDGNRQNYQIDNLELISRKTLLEQNSIHNYPPEVIELIHLLRKFERAIERKENA